MNSFIFAQQLSSLSLPRSQFRPGCFLHIFTKIIRLSRGFSSISLNARSLPLHPPLVCKRFHSKPVSFFSSSAPKNPLPDQSSKSQQDALHLAKDPTLPSPSPSSSTSFLSMFSPSA
eukprot:Sdes_comp17312_c0_seq1m6518